VLDRHVAQVKTIRQLRRRFLTSDEFQAGDAPRGPPPVSLAAPALQVETEAPPALLARMLERTGTYWSAIGETEPHWSVLTEPRFRAERIAGNAEAFHETGRAEADIIRGVLDRAGIAPASLPRCVEFGCGTGRVTLHLAASFRHVTGCDISAPHLAVAAREAEARGVRNLAWHRSTAAAPMPPGPPWDLWFSRLVLQHNPPPVIAHLLRLAFAGLAPGGVAIFQVPTYRNGYAFATEAYLAARPEADMEMHVLPQRAVFALCREAGLEVLEARDDSHMVANPALITSTLFAFCRPAG
jgi:SAM-dependent methyltransferase